MTLTEPRLRAVAYDRPSWTNGIHRRSKPNKTGAPGEGRAYSVKRAIAGPLHRNGQPEAAAYFARREQIGVAERRHAKSDGSAFRECLDLHAPLL